MDKIGANKLIIQADFFEEENNILRKENRDDLQAWKPNFDESVNIR